MLNKAGRNGTGISDRYQCCYWLFKQYTFEKGILFIDAISPIISVITRIELLGWHKVKTDELVLLNAFTENADIYPLSEPVILQTIRIRQQYKVKTPDAIIAATALARNLTLLTRNISDFDQIPGLTLKDPFEG